MNLRNWLLGDPEMLRELGVAQEETGEPGNRRNREGSLNGVIWALLIGFSLGVLGGIVVGRDETSNPLLGWVLVSIGGSINFVALTTLAVVWAADIGRRRT